MTNKEKIDYLLIDLRELENLIGSMKEVDFYPASFFNQSFQLTHKIFTELHSLENAQIEALRQQMEEHQRLIDSLQQTQPVVEPVIAPKEEEIKIEPAATFDPEPVEETEEIVEPTTEIEEETETEPEVTEENPMPTDETSEPEPKVVLEEEKEEPAPMTETNHPAEGHQKTILADKSSVSLNDILERKNLSDFRKAFSLNDRFRFRRELFGGNEDKMNQAINDLNDITSYEGSVEYLYNVLKWNIEDESVTDFLKLLEKRFS